MLDGIRRWVEIETPTEAPEQVNRLVTMVADGYRGLPATLERIPGRDGRGDHLIARSAWGQDQPGILVLSHLDTVHPLGFIERLPFRIQGNSAFGPGIYDMKGGAYLAWHAFAQLCAGSEHSSLGITHLYVSDEEIGSPTSRALIEAEGHKAKYVLVTEPARDGGKCVTSRKGVGRFEINTLGVPAHSGARHQDGRSAIKEMARQVLAIEALTDYERGVTTTVGVISGGTAPNVIPQHCRISVDLRVRDDAAGREFEAKILRLEPFDPGVKVQVTGGMNRPPFEKSAAIDVLFRHAQALARGIGFELKDTEMTGGGSDGNFTAALGVPTLDGLGIDGDGAHTEWEHGLISSIEPRTRLMRGLLETLQ